MLEEDIIKLHNGTLGNVPYISSTILFTLKDRNVDQPHWQYNADLPVGHLQNTRPVCEQYTADLPVGRLQRPVYEQSTNDTDKWLLNNGN